MAFFYALSVRFVSGMPIPTRSLSLREPTVGQRKVGKIADLFLTVLMAPVPDRGLRRVFVYYVMF